MGVNNEPFADDEDVIHGTQGVLGGGAWDAIEKVKEKPSADRTGYDFTLMCQHCSRQSVVSVPWDELAVGAARALPVDSSTGQKWLTSGGAMYPPAPCPQCSMILQVALMPDKCQRLVNVGIQMGAVDPARIQQIQAHVQQQLAAYRR